MALKFPCLEEEVDLTCLLLRYQAEEVLVEMVQVCTNVTAFSRFCWPNHDWV